MHPKAPPYLQRGIFDGLKNFRELEARISGLVTVQERGDAFEVFAEAYLATVAVEKAKQVWPGASVPPSLRKRLALTIGDKGVDGVFETQLGGHHAYQVKFRTGRRRSPGTSFPISSARRIGWTGPRSSQTATALPMW